MANEVARGLQNALPYLWEYADATARTGASGFTVSDVGKLARQLDDNTLWMLIDDSPVTWVQQGTGGAGASGAAGGVLSGTYPNPGFAVDMATQAELNTHEADTTSVHGITDTANILLKTLADAKGDILAATAADTITRLAVGSNGTVLTANSAQATGLEWATPAASGSVATDAIWDAKGDLAGGTGANTAAKLTVGSNGQVLTADSAETTGMKWATPSGGTDPNHAYYTRLAAQIEPLAIEQIRTGTFSYVVGSSTTKYIIASFRTRIGAAGRLEVRDPRKPFAIRGVTLTGLGSDSSAILLDHTLPTYSDARDTYFDRLLLLDDTAPLTIDFTAPSQTKIFLPGPYGNIITRVVNFDFTWLVAASAYPSAGFGFNLANEIGDASTDYIRFDNALLMPVSKNVVAALKSGLERSAGVGLGQVAYYICPSTWGAVTDATSYNFRDDFMGASLDTATKWTRTVSTAGNIEISTAFQWLKLTGNGSWGTNGIISQTSVARAAGKVFMCDVFPNDATTNPNLVVGWHDGAGVSYADFAHGIDFTTSGAPTGVLTIFENSNSRGNVGTGYTLGYIYRVRITLGASSAAYAIQGGPEYAAIGGSTWSDITPGTTSSTTTPVYAGAVISTAVSNCYVGDVKVY